MPPLATHSAQSKAVSEPVYAGNPTSHDHIVAKILEKTGFTAHKFQADATEAVLNGRDAVIHARTGSGKTLIFAAPHFMLKNKVSIVISPLILLQQDQQERMRKMGLSAVAINQEVHLESKTWDDLAAGKIEIVLLSPEMALHSEKVGQVFSSSAFQKALIAIHIDEAHTISSWGGNFRKDYKGLGRIRARLPKGVPATLVSATLRPNVKQDAMSTLGFSSNTSDYEDINIGNERPNVFVGAQAMKYPSSSFRDLSRFIDSNETDPLNIPKTIIYIDNVNEVTLAVVTLNNWLHESLRDRGLIMPVHAWMPAWYRTEAMAKFASGEVRIIISTDAAGMGCDIPDIKRVVQFGICNSIDTFMQRIGRCWRGPDGTGEGWLIFEPWVTSRSGKPPGRTKRRCDPLLKGLITEGECRREYLNKVYANPPSGKLFIVLTQIRKTTVPAKDCCDICDPDSSTRLPHRQFIAIPGPPRAAPVSGESNPETLSCLLNWRDTTFSVVFGSSSMFGAAALINDHDLERVSRCAPVPSIERLRRVLIKWHYVDSHLESMWNALEQGGFTIRSTPTEIAAPAPDIASQPTAQSQVTRKPPRRRNSTAPNPPAQASGSRSAVQVPGHATPAPNAPRGWWHEYLPERNYEVRQNVTMADFKRMFAKPAGANARAEDSKRSRSSTPVAPPPKRLRLDENTEPCPGPALRAPPPPSPRTPHFAPQPLARPVGRIFVPSQRPLLRPAPPDPHHTPASLARRASVSAELQHPSPVRANSSALGRAPRNRELATLVLSLGRPRAPRPSPERFTADVHRSIYELRTHFGLPRVRSGAGGL